MTSQSERCAAQYIRMSTDHQDLSPEMQKAAIETYARQNAIDVVETFMDAGRSGLTLQRRPAMKRLLEVVTSSKRAFSIILVYDISRWGRFQDTDASAYYEYHCRLHGVDVRYVQEPFASADSPISALFKSMKRAMAAEFSRELAIKTRAGQHAAIDKGFQLGSVPCLGIDRVAVQKVDGRERLLRRNEHKAGNREHVRWVLGPREEINFVRRIFQLYAASPISVVNLARQLQREGLRTREGKPVTEWMLYTFLRSESVVGNFVWGRAGPDKTRRNEEDDRFRRSSGVVEPVISRELFDAVQAKLSERKHLVLTRELLIENLQRAISEDPNLRAYHLRKHHCACRETYVTRFGSLQAAWAAAGAKYPVSLDAEHYADRSRTASTSAEFCNRIALLLREIGVDCKRHTRQDRRGQRLMINGQVILRVQVIWRRQRYADREWELKKAATGYFDWALVVRMHDDHTPLDSLFLRRDQYYMHRKWLPDALPASWNLLSTIEDLSVFVNALEPCPAWIRTPKSVLPAPK